MDRFPTIRDAKEYLIGRILAQADKDGVSLSDVERKMLYFSETGWTLPNMMVISQDFDRNYNQDEYEAKVGGVIRHVRDCAPGKHGNDDWNEAVNRLRGEDHYLLVLIAGGGKVAAKRPSGDIFRLIVAAVFVSVASVGASFFVYAHVANLAVAKNVLFVVIGVVAVAAVFLFNRR
jgi:hypothetical protein